MQAPPPEDPDAGDLPAALGAACGLMFGLGLVAIAGLPALFATSRRCINPIGRLVNCDDTLPNLIFLATLLGIPLCAWLGAKVGADLGRSNKR